MKSGILNLIAFVNSTEYKYFSSIPLAVQCASLIDTLRPLGCYRLNPKRPRRQQHMPVIGINTP